MSSLRDGLGGEELQISGLTASGTLVISPYFVGSVTAENGLVSITTVTDATGRLSSAGTGSPTTWGRLIQAGASATGGGSNVWVSFGTAFGAAPNVVATSAETNQAILVEAGSIVAGSFYVETISASQDFQWMAVGAP